MRGLKEVKEYREGKLGLKTTKKSMKTKLTGKVAMKLDTREMILERVENPQKPEFEVNDRGYTAKAFYLKNTETSKGDALIQISKDDKIVREFLFPGYKIWNIAAHFSDIVDSEINSDDQGMAAWSGFGPL